MSIRLGVWAAAFAALFAVPASAMVVHSHSDVMTERGQKFVFKFTNLEQNAAGGMLWIGSGKATTGSKRDRGFDLDGVGKGGKNEYFRVRADGHNLGTYSCGGRGQSIDGFRMNGAADCKFKLGINLEEDLLSDLVSDGALRLVVNFGGGVGHFHDGDQLNVSLKYEEVVPAPLPAGGLLLIGGLAAMGAVARRRKAKA